MNQRTQSTLEKALDINMDPQRYGSFAEIGAGQEVARQFFQAGKASQTIALTISAYDMTFSDIIYGKEKSGRYVCQSRIQKMLDREYTKLIERLGNTRGKDTCFFAFADTVATGSESKKKTSHGWMGLRFQHKPESEPSTVIVHVRLLDKHRLQQQETLSVMGVNLLYSSFYQTADKAQYVQGLFDQLKKGSIAVDALHFEGPAFKKFNEIEMNLMLIHSGWGDALFINSNGQVENASDALWGKNILVQRAFFNPVTNTHLDIHDKGAKHFGQEFHLKHNEVTPLMEFTLNNRLKNTQLTVEDAFRKVEMITSLGRPLLVTNYALFYQLKEYLRTITDRPLGIIIGAIHLEKIFDEKFYYDLQGGILEGMGKLFDQLTRLYIYPHKTQQICLLTKSFRPGANMQHLYTHLTQNKSLQDIAGCDEIEEFIHSDDILKMMKNNDQRWKKLIPSSVQKIFVSQNKN